MNKQQKLSSKKFSGKNEQQNIKHQIMHVMVGITGRTSSVPNSAHRLVVDKVQELQSGILTYTSLVLLQLF